MQSNLSNLISQFNPIPGVLYSTAEYPRFINLHTGNFPAASNRMSRVHYGVLERDPDDRICSECGQTMHKNQTHKKTLCDVPKAFSPVKIIIDLVQYRCPHCGKTHTQKIPFEAPGCRMTMGLFLFVQELLRERKMTNRMIAKICCLSEQTVNKIDHEMLKRIYCDENGNFKKPGWEVKRLGIDEFKLHNGYKFATHIIDLDTGRILFIAKGKKKQVVYDFIEFVGPEFMSNIEAVACDMNSDFEEAFKEKCPHIEPIFDFFHIVKNFNEKVCDEIRRSKVKAVSSKKGYTAGKEIKGTRYYWFYNRSKLEDKIAKQREKGKENPSDVRKLERYKELMDEHTIFAVLDGIKDHLGSAYKARTKEAMKEDIEYILDVCDYMADKKANTEKPEEDDFVPSEDEKDALTWFAKLLRSHMEGILNHAKYPISNGKIEGINNKIKTIRRMCYGLPNDEYFFLRIIDASYGTYEKNPKPHKIIQ